MNDICRLCCSTKFVCNDIFDEENALYIKMSLYLPIKVFKNDRLPQKICDKCSCKVNDFYQFCNETIEVQNRLRTSLLSHEVTTLESVDLTLVKENVNSPPPTSVLLHCEQSTQTEDITLAEVTDDAVKKNVVKVKQELQPPSLPVKIEEDADVSDHSHNDPPEDIPSDNSDDMCLINLKNRKQKSKSEGRSKLSANGDIIGSKKRKRKKKYDELQSIISKLPDGVALTLVNDNVPNEDASFDSIKQEITEEKPHDLKVFLETIKKVKHEANDGEIFNCCICFEQFFNRSTMSQHYREHGGEIEAEEPPAPPPLPNQHPLKCTRCQKVVSEKEWGMHWLQHWDRDRRPYRCALCEKSFRDHQQILKHGMTHKFGKNGTDPTQPDKRFVCDLCPEGFVYMKYLLSHRTRAHPDAATRPLTLRCAQCAREFAHLNSLRRHLRAHSGERNFLCNVCGKALSSREHLKFHIRIHTGYKPNVCKTCGKGFVKKCNLTLHERVHSGEKPHVCSHCGKAFSQRSTLVIHERYHSGQRPYVCGLCGRGFVAKGLLSMHLKTTCI